MVTLMTFPQRTVRNAVILALHALQLQRNASVAILLVPSE